MCLPEQGLTVNNPLNLPHSPTAEFLRLKLISHDASDGYVRIGFEPRPEFLNPAGVVQGGFLAAILDDCVGPAVWARTNGQLFTVTIGLNVTYLAPVPCEPLVGEGRVVQLGKTIGFVDAQLMDQKDRVLVRASATVRLVPADRVVPQGKTA
jgi:uncharacterized protein (TIGR00369 family)